jgi:aminopeptidase-like protein
VAVCVGDPGKMVYKKTRGGNAEIDRAVEKILQDSGEDHEVIDFYPFGYDERQYNSPGIKLNVGSLSRSSHGRFPQYHTSADNLDLIHPEYLADSLAKYLSVLYVLEHNRRYVNQNPCGEPQLGKRGLYAAIGGQAETKSRELAMLWVLNMSDGEHDLLDIARCAAMKFEFIKQAADLLHQQGLLKVAERSRAAQSHD